MVVLHTTYFGSVDWYRQIACAEDDVVYIEAHENYVKQTERNRCYIATANGKQMLTVPVTIPHLTGTSKENSLPLTGGLGRVSDVLISDHGNWQHNHWEALKTAYGMSPFFDFYQDDIRPFFEERWNTHDIHNTHPVPGCSAVRLYDHNLAIAKKMLELLGITKELQPTISYQGALQLKSSTLGFCPPITGEPKGVQRPLTVRLYYQTFQRRNGFIPGLSILDLLFNEGPESIKYLTS